MTLHGLFNEHAPEPASLGGHHGGTASLLPAHIRDFATYGFRGSRQSHPSRAIPCAGPLAHVSAAASRAPPSWRHAIACVALTRLAAAAHRRRSPPRNAFELSPLSRSRGA